MSLLEQDPDEQAHAEALARIAAPVGPSLLAVLGEAMRPDPEAIARATGGDA